MSSVPSEEEVKLFQILITLRIKYWTLKPGCGVVTSFDTGYDNSATFHKPPSITCSNAFNLYCISLISDPAQVYTCMISLEYTRLILCCLSKRAEGLELFIPELDKHSEKIQKYLHRKFVSL